MTDPRTTLRARRAAGAGGGGPRLRFGYGKGQIVPETWQWFAGKVPMSVGWPMLAQAEELVAWCTAFLAQAPADVATPDGIEHWDELVTLLAEHRAAQATQKAAAPRKPRARARASTTT